MFIVYKDKFYLSMAQLKRDYLYSFYIIYIYYNNIISDKFYI